jgi:ribonuclease D
MNKRIRQLADEAGLRFTQLMSNPMVPVVDGKETDLAKFAELIVAECIDTAFHRGHPDLEFLLKHFGVEE